jgi:hypothetical protein
MLKRIILIIFICAAMLGPAGAQETAFDPIDHTYVYDIQENGSVRCTWSITLLPKEESILYTYAFRGGETQGYEAEDSLGQHLDVDVNEQDSEWGGQKTVSLLLSNYTAGEPYQFNLSFTWDGPLSSNGDRQTLYTNVNVGEPQAAGIIVILPQGSEMGISYLIVGNSTQQFQKTAISGRDALLWRTNNTGNDTEIILGADFDYNSDLMKSRNNMLESLYNNQDLSAISRQENQPLIFALPAKDMNGDSIWDFLVLNMSSDPESGAFKSEISAMSGYDGSTLWQKEYTDALAFAYPVGDLNGDGLNDVVANVVIAGMSFIPYSSLEAISGCNGAEIWSRPQLLAATFAYPTKDATGDNATDMVVHIFGIDSLNNSLVTKICSVDGKNGAETDCRVFPGALAVEYPVGNLTSDSVQDSIIAELRINEAMQDNISMGITALDGVDRVELWNMIFKDRLALAMPIQDITGDKLDDLLIYVISNATSNATSASLQIMAVQGMDGKVLWDMPFGNTLAMALTGPDLTGDGIRDLIVYRMNESGENNVEAVKGDDGSLLWSKPNMILWPQ